MFGVGFQFYWNILCLNFPPLLTHSLSLPQSWSFPRPPYTCFKKSYEDGKKLAVFASMQIDYKSLWFVDLLDREWGNPSRIWFWIGGNRWGLGGAGRRNRRWKKEQQERYMCDVCVCVRACSRGYIPAGKKKNKKNFSPSLAWLTCCLQTWTTTPPLREGNREMVYLKPWNNNTLFGSFSIRT